LVRELDPEHHSFERMYLSVERERLLLDPQHHSFDLQRRWFEREHHSLDLQRHSFDPSMLRVVQMAQS
jgi:hypothetical protein